MQGGLHEKDEAPRHSLIYSLEPEGSGAGGGRRDEVCGHGADGAVDRGEGASGDVVHSSFNLKSWIWEVLVLCV